MRKLGKWFVVRWSDGIHSNIASKHLSLRSANQACFEGAEVLPDFWLTPDLRASDVASIARAAFAGEKEGE